jgi:hypothetical protein
MPAAMPARVDCFTPDWFQRYRILWMEEREKLYPIFDGHAVNLLVADVPGGSNEFYWDERVWPLHLGMGPCEGAILTVRARHRDIRRYIHGQDAAVFHSYVSGRIDIEGELPPIGGFKFRDARNADFYARVRSFTA